MPPAVWRTLFGPRRPTPTQSSPEIVLTRSYSIDDGRYINNGWLQEMPDPVTKLTWDNAALVSPDYAKHLGVDSGDMIEIAVTEGSKESKPENEVQPKSANRGSGLAGPRRQFDQHRAWLRTENDRTGRRGEWF